MPSQAAKYRTKGAELNDKFFNDRFLDIDARLVELEQVLSDFGGVRDALVQLGLQQINTQLQQAIAALVAQVDATQQAFVNLVAQFEPLQEAIEEIISGGVLPAGSVAVEPIGGVAATNVQEALAEHQSDIAGLQDQVNGLGDVHVVADLTEASALIGLDRGDIIHVEDNGSGSWARYQVLVPGDGTWNGSTKVTIFEEGQQPAGHVHAIEDVTGLQDALNDKLDATAKAADSSKWDGRTLTVSAGDPSGGADGDIWFKYE